MNAKANLSLHSLSSVLRIPVVKSHTNERSHP